MSPDPKAEQERDDFEYDPPRSIFAATWFRALLVLIVVGVIGAIAVPWALDWMNPPSTTATAAVQSAPLPVAVAPPATPSEVPAASAAVGAVSATAPSSEPATARPLGEPVSSVAAPTAEPAPTDTSSIAAPPAQGKAETPAEGRAKPAADAPAKKPARATRTVAQAAPAASGATWWVQVGAFKDAQTAQRVAEKLRAESFQVQETTVTRTGSAGRSSRPAPAGGPTNEQYDVFVSGGPAGELTGRLTTKGLASEPSGGGVVVRPSLPLRDAVALSKDLASEGLKVQVRRSGGDPAGSPSAAPAATAGGETLHRVRVGGFSDRAAATAAMRELESKGFKGFLARGGS